MTSLYSLYLRGVDNTKHANLKTWQFHERVQSSAQETLRALAAGWTATVVAKR